MEEYLNKNYTQEEVESLLSSGESINLEFKRGDALEELSTSESKKKEIAKDVSAVANSDGGIIIYGVDETSKSISPCKVSRNLKEQLEQIINFRIQRKIDNLKIDVIEYNNNSDELIFVVKIPRSLNAPHMTSDKKFYKRYNFQSVQMEEYEIRGSYNRIEKTELEIIPPQIRVSDGQPDIHSPDNKIFSALASIDITVKNVGNTIEKIYKMECRIPSRLGTKLDKEKVYEYMNTEEYKKYFNRNENEFTIFVFPNLDPLFQNELFNVKTIYATIKKDTFNIIAPVTIKLYFSNGTTEYTFDLLKAVKEKGYTADRFAR